MLPKVRQKSGLVERSKRKDDAHGWVTKAAIRQNIFGKDVSRFNSPRRDLKCC